MGKPTGQKLNSLWTECTFLRLARLRLCLAELIAGRGSKNRFTRVESWTPNLAWS